jgi:hypothetical protein
MSRAERRAMVDCQDPALAVTRQCELLATSRSPVYRRPVEVSEEDDTIMAMIDRQYLARPFLRLTPHGGVAGEDKVHERLVHKLDTFTDLHRAAQQRIRDLIWRFYRELKVYQAHPSPQPGPPYAPVSIAFSGAAPISSPSIACSPASTPTSPNCSSSSTGRRSRSTPTDRRTTSAAKSQGERSAAARAATPGAIAAMHF